MWKLAFQDKFDGGSRVKDLLGDLCTEDKGKLINTFNKIVTYFTNCYIYEKLYELNRNQNNDF